MGVVNEVLQWLAILGCGFLLLGVFYETRQGASSVPEPWDTSGLPVGSRPSREVLAALRTAASGSHLHLWALFVSESCTGCRALLAEVEEIMRDRSGLDRRSFVVVVVQPSEAFRAALDDAGIDHLDDDGSLWDQFKVPATPYVVQFDREGRILRKGVQHYVDVDARAH